VTSDVGDANRVRTAALGCPAAKLRRTFLRLKSQAVFDDQPDG